MSLESTPTEPSNGSTARRVLEDPLALRAFAHPLRLALHRLLVREGRCSAAHAGRELGISQALATHHLRQLAKYGFAEQVTGADRRERPWRALSSSLTWVGADATDEGAVATNLLEQALVEQIVSNLLSWQQLRRQPDQGDWRALAQLDTSFLYLTSSEAAELGRQFDELCRPYVARRHDPALRPDQSRPVEVTLLAVPLRPTSSGA